ncbi:hypothetical protein [Fluviicola chungangensis]|uniref:Uncharacterized protein n=1 Tax=Fluviicola chungangensis TaxID=2597671 RepID=A0A556N6F8_9FLAO|nr:hypothetical protein [Fluviicola chungangensis]TSJ47609.1 hypothetical protein FO442_00335 [Fluviicola chungangensis]
MNRYQRNIDLLNSIRNYLPLKKDKSTRLFLSENDLDGYDDAELFRLFFVFCQDNLDKNGKKFGMPNALFCFERNNGLNAWACRHKDMYIISMYDMYFQTLKRRIIDENRLVETLDFEKKYGRLLSVITVRIEDLIFHSSTLFTYYHELAHLIQYKSKESEMKFESDDDSSFSLLNHIYEFDADLNGSQFVCFHLLDYIINSNIVDDKLVEQLLSIGLASILITRLILEDYKDDSKVEPIYFREKSHPHTVVRAVYILNHMVYTAKNNLQYSHLNDKNILQDCFSIVSDFFNDSKLKEFLEEFYYNPKPVEDYVNFLNSESENHQELVRFQHHLFDID